MERFENKGIKGEGAALLSERTVVCLLVEIFEDVEGCFAVKRIEERFVSHFNPFDNLVKVSHCHPVKFKEAQLSKQGVQVFKEYWQFGLEDFLVQVHQRFGEWVVQKIEVVGRVEAAVACEKQGKGQFRTLVFLLVVLEI